MLFNIVESLQFLLSLEKAYIFFNGARTGHKESRIWSSKLYFTQKSVYGLVLPQY